jgi:hypothetical protein
LIRPDLASQFRVRAGSQTVNTAIDLDLDAPYGGFKMSGTGRNSAASKASLASPNPHRRHLTAAAAQVPLTKHHRPFGIFAQKSTTVPHYGTWAIAHISVVPQWHPQGQPN